MMNMNRINVARMVTRQFRNVSVFSALALLGLQAIGHANTLQYTRGVGTISEDGHSCLSVSLGVYKSASADANATSLYSGAILIGGRSGKLKFTLSANPASMTLSSQTVRGGSYHHTVIITQPFSYLDLTTFQRTQAWMEVDATQVGSGQVGFKIYRVLDNTLLAETEAPNAPGVFSELPLVSGNCLISRP